MNTDGFDSIYRLLQEVYSTFKPLKSGKYINEPQGMATIYAPSQQL